MDKVKQWVALAVVGCLAVAASGWFLLVSPKRGEAAELRLQADAQQAANAGLQTQLEVLKSQAKDLPKKQADLARVAAKIPDNPALPALIRSLTAASISAGVQLLSITPGQPATVAAAAPVAAPEPAAPADPAAPSGVAAAPAGDPAAAAAGTDGALAEMSLAVNVTGGYFEIEQFLSNLEGLPRAMRVKSFSLAPGGSTGTDEKAGSAQAGRTLTTTITGSVFMSANRPAAAPVAAPAN